jgi:hypothetical protein
MDPAPCPLGSKKSGWRTRPRTLGARSLVLVAASWLAVACTSTATPPEPDVIYSGQLEVYLEPFDDKGVCSITIGLRNVAGARQNDANLKLAWFDSAGDLIAEQALRMDPLLVGRTDGKNLALPVRCRQIGQLTVRRAEWDLFEGWGTPAQSVVRIDGVEGTEWAFVWDEQNGLFVGRIQGR